MRIGYARVSTHDQNIEMQMRALRAAGCAQIYADQGLSGASRSRPGLVRSLSELSAGDTLVIWRLDRLGRSLSHLIEVVAELGRKEIGLYSITESIDTASAGGILIFHIMGALAEFERALISERTKAGMSAARARGSAIGRPIKLMPGEVDAALEAMAKGVPLAAAARQFGVSRSTLYRSLRRDADRPPGPKAYGAAAAGLPLFEG
ncbi:MAG: recombinase family protein [Allorhizobium sp.]